MKKLYNFFSAGNDDCIIQLCYTPLWMRDARISPDGKEIVFCYKEATFTKSPFRGTATQLTTQASYEANPVWSPDGKQIAFCQRPEWELRSLYHVC